MHLFDQVHILKGDWLLATHNGFDKFA